MRRAWPVLLLLGFCQLCSSWGSLAIIAVQVEMREGLAVSADAIAALVWVYSLTMAIGAPLAQALIGDWPRRAVLFWSLALLAAGAAALGLAQTWEQAMIARTAMAVGAASVLPTASVIAASMVAEEERAAALSFVFGGLTASIVIALPISSLVAEQMGWRVSWFTAGAAAAVAAAGVALWAPRGVAGAKASLAAMAAVVADRVTSFTILTTALLICGGFMTYSMMAFWFVEVGGAPRSALTLALFVAGVAGMFGNALSSLAARLVGREGTVLLGLTFTASCFAVLWAAPDFYPLSYPAFVLFGVGWSLCLAPLQARLVEAAGERAQLALALNASAFFGGQGLGAAVGGVVYEGFGPAVLPLGSVLVIGLAALVFAGSRR